MGQQMSALEKATFPSSKSWAPLRLEGAGGGGVEIFRFSQLQKLGSIATATDACQEGEAAAFPSSKSWAPLRHLLVKYGEETLFRLFPAPKAGLHCDMAEEPPDLAPGAGFPSSKSWAPLRHGQFVVPGVDSAAFSQLQKLGSIATARPASTIS